jgi:hypothetical protein
LSKKKRAKNAPRDLIELKRIHGLTHSPAAPALTAAIILAIVD